MSELVAAIDETDDGEYLAFVVGSPNTIQVNSNILPPKFTHMTTMNASKDDKLKLLHRFDLTGNILVCCVKFGLPEIKKSVDTALSSGRCRKPKKIVYSKVAYEFVDEVRFLYTNFTLKNKMRVDDLIFEVDNPTVKQFLRDGGLKYTSPSDAHKIADCIAYANGHHWHVHEAVKDQGTTFKNKFHAKIIRSLARLR